MLLDRAMMAAINNALRAAGKVPMKRKDFRRYQVFGQQFADGIGVVEVFSAGKEMYLAIDQRVIGWAELNNAAVEACRADPRLYEIIFHLFNVVVEDAPEVTHAPIEATVAMDAIAA